MKVSAGGEVSDARHQEAGAQPVPMDLSGDTAPGREQRERGRRKITCRHSLLQLALSRSKKQLARVKEPDSAPTGSGDLGIAK